MKPLKLEFEGINSFSEHTIIDFEKLTKNGIFGIFGDTGSGKSTILDSINFALYGNVERSREKTDIINYKSGSAKVKFSFNIINDGKRKIYTVERVLKRDKNGTHKAFLYENDGEREICLADKTSQVERKVTEILGVQAEDFRKCIALPQGEFAQFVKSAPRERLALIERLFSLSKYGDALREKLSAKQSEAESLFQNISGKMSAYDGVSREALKEVCDNLKQKRELLKTIECNHSKAVAKREKSIALNDKRKELEQTLCKLENLNSKKEEINELKNSLSLLSVCREVVECDGQIKQKQHALDGIEEDIMRLQRKFSDEVTVVAQLEKSIRESDFDNKIADCVARAAMYSANAGKVEKIKSLSGELVAKRAEYRKKDEELSQLLKDYSSVENALKTTLKRLEDCDEADISKIVNDELKAMLLRNENVDALNYFKDLKDGVEIYKEDTPLFKFVSYEVGKKLEEYKEKVELTKCAELGGVEEKLEKYQAVLKERDNIQKLASEYSDKLHKIDAEIKLKRKELEISQNEGKDLRARADEIELELKNAFGNVDADFSVIINENEAKLNLLKRQKEELFQKLENINKSKSDLVVSIERLKTLSLTAQAEINNLREKVQSLLKISELDGVENCFKLTERFKNITDAEKTIADYELQFGALSVRKKELESVKGINDISDEKLAEEEAAIEQLSQSISAVTGEIAVLVSDKCTLETKLDEKSVLTREFEQIKKSVDLISRLKEVTKGNKFLEYIANEYLCDISALASSTLLKLRDGRYFLTYKDGNFFVGDNFNCGNLRGVNTLSGGETFLVSLSLALALSQTICAKSMKTIEFFFLDEGFGTLDSTLVDTVMNALEKLKSSAFTIGVISHVEELKYRIDSKITVNKATETHGSTVTVSC